MEKYLWILLVIVAGACLPVQTGLNNKIGKVLESPIHASFVSFTVGAISILVFILLFRIQYHAGSIQNVPTFAWTSGLFGAFYVVIAIMGYQKLGVPVTFGLIITGQMIASLILEHNNILVAAPHPINWARIAGVGLIIGGVVLIRNF